MSHNRIEIIPAIMPESYDDLREKVAKVVGLVPTVQIDVMDGVFVPAKTWPYQNVDGHSLSELAETEEFLPHWDEVSYEIDLMVEHPEDVIDAWLTVGVRRIIVHIESTEQIADIIEKFERRDSTELDVFPVELGLALNIETPFTEVMRYMHDVDFIQLMGIGKIGYQGQAFDERVIEKISDLRRECPHLIISIDGGVSRETAPQLLKAGATRLVSGSTIFTSEDIRGTIRTLAEV